MLNKFLTALLSLGLAVGLWLYVVTVISPGSENSYSDIPVVLQSEGILQERGLMITTAQTPTVDLRLSGNRSDLNKLNIGNILVTVDVSKITEPGDHQLSFNVGYPGDVANNAVNVEYRNPDYITLTVQERITKNVPVVISYKGDVADNLKADKENVELDNPQIQITGPADVINEITQARIDVSLQGREETFSEGFPYTLCNDKNKPVDSEMVVTNASQVNLTLRIFHMKEVPLVVTVVSGGGATEQTSQITIDPMVITVSGTEKQLEDLPNVILGTLDLATILEDSTQKFAITLPEGVNNESGLAEATVQISFPDLRTKNLNVSNIQPVNVPEGKEAEINTRALELRFRGPKALVDELTDKDITVTVDFSQAQDGTATMRVEIKLADKFAELGVIGNYSVSATLRKADKKN